MMRKLLFAGLLSSAALIASSGAWAQNEGAVGSVGNITDSTSSATNQSANEAGALSSSGGNVFDFSSSSRNTPGAPPLSNFGTGPCIGAGYTAAGSGPGFSLGVGHQSIDDSCTRRAWAQALVAASQQMPEYQSDLREIAYELMLAEPIVRDAVISLNARRNGNLAAATPAPSYGNGQVATRAAAPAAPNFQPTTTYQPRQQASTGCVIAVAQDAPAGIEQVLEARGCATARM